MISLFKIFWVTVLVFIIGMLIWGCTEIGFPRTVHTEFVPLHGFMAGMFHGIIVVFSFVGSFFSDTIMIYDRHNTGWWYDFGFVFGILWLRAAIGGD